MPGCIASKRCLSRAGLTSIFCWPHTCLPVFVVGNPWHPQHMPSKPKSQIMTRVMSDTSQATAVPSVRGGRRCARPRTPSRSFRSGTPAPTHSFARYPRPNPLLIANRRRAARLLTVPLATCSPRDLQSFALLSWLSADGSAGPVHGMIHRRSGCSGSHEASNWPERRRQLGILPVGDGLR